jgi:hypothetical protein
MVANRRPHRRPHSITCSPVQNLLAPRAATTEDIDSGGEPAQRCCLLTDIQRRRRTRIGEQYPAGAYPILGAGRSRRHVARFHLGQGIHVGRAQISWHTQRNSVRICCHIRHLVLAERLHVSANRIRSSSVWAATIFLLNFLAFLLMGLQAREIIISGLSGSNLSDPLTFSGLVLGVTVGVRLVWVMAYNRIHNSLWSLGLTSEQPPTLCSRFWLTKSLARLATFASCNHLSRRLYALFLLSGGDVLPRQRQVVPAG